MTHEEMEDLLALSQHPGIKPLLMLMQDIVAKMGMEVISTSLPISMEEATVKLFEKRCRYDGAKAGFDALQSRLKELRKEVSHG